MPPQTRAKLIIYFMIGILAVVLFLVLTGIIPGFRVRPPSPFTIEIWGTENQEVWDALATEYRTLISTATITYTQKSEQTYETELVDALASGRGPDIFLIPNSALVRHGAKISPLPDGEFTYKRRDLKTIFSDAIAENIANADGALLGVPLGFEPLALFYNRDYLNAENIPSPPKTWEEVATISRRLARFSQSGALSRGGIALGTARGVLHAPDILLALITQTGGALFNRETREGRLENPAVQSALAFYLSFADPIRPSYVWSDSLSDSVTAFALGNTALLIGYPRDVLEIARLNPQLNFDVAPLPQTNLAGPQKNFGRFHIAVVSRVSDVKPQAWQFLLWLQNGNVQKRYIDSMGIAPARRDQVNGQPPREYLAPFYGEVLSSGVVPLELGDNLLDALRGAISDVGEKHFPIVQALSRANTALSQFLKQEPPR